MILCLDTAISQCGVGLIHEGEMIDYSESESSMKASELLHQMIDQLLEKNDISLSQLKGVAINGGPGSYTGLRIGAASAKGFCYALDIPLIHINCLELMMSGITNRLGQNDHELYVPMIDARRNEVFTAVYDKYGDEALPPQPMILETDSFQEYADKDCLFFGNGAEKASSILSSQANFKFSNHQTSMLDFTALVEIKWKFEQFEDLVNYSPGYLKKFHSTSSKK